MNKSHDDNLNVRASRMIRPLAAALLVCLSAMGGCQTETHAQAREKAHERWTAARASIVYGLAKQQFDVGDLDKSQTTIQQAMEVDPDNPVFLELAGRIHLEKGELERAFHHVDRSISLNDKRATAHYVMGVILQRWQRYDAALREYELAHHHAPDHESGLLASAEMLVKLDRPQEAIKRLADKLSYFENKASLRSLLGRIHSLRGEHEQAVLYYRQAHLLAPESERIQEQLGLALMAHGEYGEAIYLLTRVADSAPPADARHDLRIAIADCHRAMGKPGQAAMLFLQVTQAAPQNGQAWLKLSEAAWQVGDADRADQAAQRAIELLPDRFEPHVVRGMVAEGKKDLAAAIAHYDRAALIGTSSPLPLMLKGMALERSGKKEQALELYRQAMQKAPQDDRARRLVAGLEANG